ncbi:MAG TPA: exopolysaccharide biosynthesis protein [Gaiellaceae bacterium]|nr:exopolysaccharide biosynthesis protein [Gaiellaceae bacterium]
MDAAATAFSDELERWLREGGDKTLGALGSVFEERGFAVAIILLMFLPALPVPTGGVTHVFEAITVLLAAQMVLGRRTIWLPARWQRRELGATTTEKAIPFIVRRIRQVERFSRPRAGWLFDQGVTMRLLGLVVIAFAVAAALAPPFSGLDTLPALGAVVIALSIILRDVVVLAAGILLGVAGVALLVTIGAALARLLRRLV